MATKISRAVYADMYGPTTGDKAVSDLVTDTKVRKTAVRHKDEVCHRNELRGQCLLVSRLRLTTLAVIAKSENVEVPGRDV